MTFLFNARFPGKCALLLLLCVQTVFAQAAGHAPVVQAMIGTPNHFTIFAKVNGSGVTTLDAIGQAVGSYELVAVDVAQGSADFRRDGKIIHVWLGEGHTKTLTPKVPGGFVRIPLPKLSAIKRLIVVGGLDLNDPKVMKGADAALDHDLNDPKLSWEERQKRLAELLSGEHPFIMVGMNPISDEEGRAAGWAPEHIVEVNRMRLMNPPRQ